ncbi:hypothetical protein J8N05_14660 [Streptomyces sp. BH-SS-21]|uniref:Secreted protein n=1 Tax=Streptomyces liliiviolaceus TaxID=2823109 RepID=A0A940XTT7_9ACTN|nr:hypothetical protein [Streptomyces liliiviolaceus]MBQ0849443.1 hypothetical protein [Streptomyces liliiviolaceus]
MRNLRILIAGGILSLTLVGGAGTSQAFAYSPASIEVASNAGGTMPAAPAINSPLDSAYSATLAGEADSTENRMNLNKVLKRCAKHLRRIENHFSRIARIGIIGDGNAGDRTTITHNELMRAGQNPSEFPEVAADAAFLAAHHALFNEVADNDQRFGRMQLIATAIGIEGNLIQNAGQMCR